MGFSFVHLYCPINVFKFHNFTSLIFSLRAHLTVPWMFNQLYFLLLIQDVLLGNDTKCRGRTWVFSLYVQETWLVYSWKTGHQYFYCLQSKLVIRYSSDYDVACLKANNKPPQKRSTHNGHSQGRWRYNTLCDPKRILKSQNVEGLIVNPSVTRQISLTSHMDVYPRKLDKENMPKRH